MTADVVIVGGGAIGAACARELARTGRRVVVLERGGATGQAWRAAAGMLAPQIETERDDPLFRLGLAARDHYRALAAALCDSTGIDIGLWQEGIVHVARNDADAEPLHHKVAWQRQAGQECAWLDAAEVRERWPWLTPMAGAFWAPHDGALHPARLVQALLDDARQHGATVEHDTIATILWDGDRVTGVAGNVGRYPAADVIIAAGAWSGQLGGLPSALPVTPVRGQMAALPWPAKATRGIVFGPHGYLVARDGEALVGSTMEYVGFDATTTPAGITTILNAATSLSATLAGPPRRVWAGLRPISPDGLPILGPAPARRGLWYAAGHGRNGILLAGLTGVILARWLAGEIVGEVADHTVDTAVARCAAARFA